MTGQFCSWDFIIFMKAGCCGMTDYREKRLFPQKSRALETAKRRTKLSDLTRSVTAITFSQSLLFLCILAIPSYVPQGQKDFHQL